MAETGGQPLTEASIVVKGDVQVAADVQKATPAVKAAVDKMEGEIGKVATATKGTGDEAGKAGPKFTEMASRVAGTIGALNQLYEGVKAFNAAGAVMARELDAIKAAFSGIGGSELQGFVAIREQIEGAAKAQRDQIELQKEQRGIRGDVAALLLGEAETQNKLLQVENEKANALERVKRIEEAAAKKRKEDFESQLAESTEAIRISLLSEEDRINAEKLKKQKDLQEKFAALGIEADEKIKKAIQMNLLAIDSDARAKLKKLSDDKKKASDDETKKARENSIKAAADLKKAFESALSKIDTTEIEARIGQVASILETIARKTDAQRGG